MHPHTPHSPGNSSPWLSVASLPPSIPPHAERDHPILTCALTGRAGARGRAGLGAVGFEADAQDVLSRLRGSGTEDAADLGDMEEAGGDTAGRGSGLWAEGTVTSSGCCPPESPSCPLPAVKVTAAQRQSCDPWHHESHPPSVCTTT